MLRKRQSGRQEAHHSFEQCAWQVIAEISTTVKIGSVPAPPNDIIIGDSSNIVVMPLERAAEVARRAAELEHQDRHVRQQTDPPNPSITEALRKFAKL